MPLGSSFEKTKHEKAVLNSSPQGPCAIPPRQGQSQFISPVSSLNAPCCEASSSSSSGDCGSASDTGAGALGSMEGGEEDEGVIEAVGLSSGVGGRKREDGESVASVGRLSSSLGVCSSSTKRD